MSAPDIRNLADAWGYFAEGVDGVVELDEDSVEALRIAFYSGARSYQQLAGKIMARPAAIETKYALLQNLIEEADAAIDECELRCRHVPGGSA